MTAAARTAADGLLLVDKPPGLTSHDVVARVRRLTGTRRVGHAGTLDPMATGVLVLGIGRATRLLTFLVGTDKAYDATVRLGVATATDDAEGEVVAEHPAADLDPAAVRAAMAPLTGPISQVPSSVSAIKVDGKRSYARVRAGETVELAARPVVVPVFDLLAVRPAGAALDLEVHVECSSGTYVRALARDLGAALGVGGHLTALRRTRVGPYGIGAARSLESLAERFELTPLAEAVQAVFPRLDLDAAAAGRLAHGAALPLPEGVGGQVLGAYGPDGDVIGLVRERDGMLRALVVFAPA